MKMFPGCRSACTNPSSKIIFSSVESPSRATRFGSDRVAGVDRIFVPSMKLMVRMRSVESSSTSSGKTTSGWPAKLRRNRRLLAASMRKSSCAKMARPNSSTVASGSSVAIEGMTPSSRAPWRMTARSKVHRATTSGRRTLTATMRPSGRRALWTCETDADASGTGENSA